MRLYDYYNKPEDLDIPDFGDNAKTACDFACDVLKLRNKKLEDIIAKSPQYSLAYAMIVLNYHRFEPGEAAIATNAHTACTYAYSILKGRFPEAEPLIATVTQYAVQYAKNVINGRWPEAEHQILYGSGYDQMGMLYRYIRDVVKERWPSAEPIIQKSDYKDDYEKLFRCTL